jgi:cytochrome c oxidase cbb3-type subunit III
MPTKIEKDIVSGQDTTGHEWDGIKELDTPIPRWWWYVLWATVIFSAVYVVLYPTFPTSNGSNEGLLGWSQYKVLAEDQAAAAVAQKGMRDKIATADLDAITADGDMLNFAMAGGRAAFGDNCAPCHGSGAQGFTGYPNLNDDEWLWGGKLTDISTTIRYGIRTSHDEARDSEMPAFGVDEMLEARQINAVADYVLALSKGSAVAGEGAEIFAENCVACHGEKGTGDKEQGAPSLVDAVWLYGSDKASVVQTITASRKGVMPAWTGRLDEATIKSLAVYVHSLGGGQ